MELVGFLSHDRVSACLAVLVWAMILGMFVVHPKLTMHRLGHRVFVGNGGVLTGGTDVTTTQPLVTVGDGVLMGQEPTVIEACFAAGLQVIADLTQMGAFTPARAEIAMRAAFDRSDSPTAPDELPSVADAVITSLAYLAEQIVWLRMEVEQDQLNAA